MSTTVLILLVLLVIYIPLWVIVWKNPNALSHGFEKYGPCIKINTKYGLKFIDRFGRYSRFFHFLGILSQFISLVLMVLMIITMALAVISLPSTLTSSGVGIEYALAIPGLNPLLPLWYGLLALIIALVCHEMAHGLQSRANGISVKHTGLLYAVVPLGAFVEPDEEDVKKASRRAKLDLYTAGISTNFVLAAVSFIIFSSVMLGGISSPYGDNCAVYSETSDSPAYGVIPAGAIIEEVGGEDFVYDSGYYEDGAWKYGWAPGTSQTILYRTESGEMTADIYFGTYVESVVSGSPADNLTYISGSSITSLKGILFNSIVYEGHTYQFATAAGFSNFMKSTESGKEVVINYTKADGSSGSVSTVLASSGSIGFLGVVTTTSGMSLITPDALLKTAADPFYGVDSITSGATAVLSYLAHPFSGFDPVPESVQWWYGDQVAGFWTVCEMFYWIFWLNLLLGITNALPAFPFDGGYVFCGWVDTLLEKFGVRDQKKRENISMEVTQNVSSFMLFLYALVIVAILI